MVARIKTSKSIRRVLQYNEQKCREGHAELLLAENFLKDADALTLSDKLRHFQQLQALNERTKTNTLHIFLSFDPSEQLDKKTHEAIARRYMHGIGFADQPYLVYRHDDAGHPHLHIVTTNIRFDGSRIALHNLGRGPSEDTRKAIEQAFGLVKAEGHGWGNDGKITPVSAQKILYGKSSTKRAISKVLGLVIDQYKYSSLEELNAVLGLYNVVADRGAPGSKMHAAGGLIYQVLDGEGRKVSTPIKASAFFMQPTLKNLELKMKRNEGLKKPHAKRIRAAIDFALLKKKTPDLNYLVQALAQQQIRVLFRQTGEGFIYGLTFIDHQSKVMFNGSDLGKSYSAKAILERCQLPAWKRPASVRPYMKPLPLVPFMDLSTVFIDMGRIVTELMAPEVYSKTFVVEAVPYPYRKTKKRRRRLKK